MLAWLSPIAASAIAVYAASLVLWMYTLTRVAISEAFLFFSLSFFLVPLLSNIFYGDPLQRGTWIGATLILVGVTSSSLIK